MKTGVLKKPLTSMRAGPPADVCCGRIPLAIALVANRKENG
jgi:hypothetical protein